MSTAPRPDNLIDKVSPRFIVTYISLCGLIFTTLALTLGLRIAALSLLLTFILGPILINAYLTFRAERDVQRITWIIQQRLLWDNLITSFRSLWRPRQPPRE